MTSTPEQISINRWQSELLLRTKNNILELEHITDVVGFSNTFEGNSGTNATEYVGPISDGVEFGIVSGSSYQLEWTVQINIVSGSPIDAGFILIDETTQTIMGSVSIADDAYPFVSSGVYIFVANESAIKVNFDLKSLPGDAEIEVAFMELKLTKVNDATVIQ